VPIHPPRGPGKHYTASDLPSFAPAALKNRDFARGRELYIAAACQACHRLGNDGGGIGPDLTGAANRYTLGDLLENVIEPSKVISDQYESTILEMKDGRTIIGRVTGEEGGILQVVVDPSAPNRTTDLMKADVKTLQVSPVSLMPPGLIDSMNRNEVLDLMAYILSGGQRNNPMFKK
jgi:putative heme-binding domain-containing protein